jgi:pimeloyl-ACP methyl ester carboxylesterase
MIMRKIACLEVSLYSPGAMYPWHVSVRGEGPRVVLVHGSVSNGSSWSSQAELAEHVQLVVPDRGGYWPNPPREPVSFDVQAAEIAELVEPGTHLVGHSYGGVLAILAAGLRPDEVASLTVLEPPFFGIAMDDPAIGPFAGGMQRIFDEAPDDPREFLIRFFRHVGSDFEPPDPLPKPMVQGVATLRSEPLPWRIPELPPAVDPPPFRCLVVSGGHSPAHERLGDLLAERFRGERAVLPGKGHMIPRVGAPLNELLLRFVGA